MMRDTTSQPGFARLLASRPAFDRRHPSPREDYGIGGVELYFVLRGPQGATVFTLLTGWHLDAVIRAIAEAVSQTPSGAQQMIELLKIEPGFRADTIRRALLAHHPDRGGDGGIFAALTEARRVVEDHHTNGDGP